MVFLFDRKVGVYFFLMTAGIVYMPPMPKELRPDES